MKRIVSLILTVCITLSLFVTLGVTSGLVNTSAATTNEANELWMVEGSSKALLKGAQINIENGAEPYRFMGASLTAYVPLEPVCKFFGGSYTRSENTVTVTYGSDTATLTVGSMKWSLSTGAETSDFGLPVVLGDEGAVYVTTGIANNVANALMGKEPNADDRMRHWMHKNAGIVVFSFSNICYDEEFLDGSYEPSSKGKPKNDGTVGLTRQLSVLNKMLFETPTGDQIYNALSSNVGLGTHPRILVTQDRFDELNAAYAEGADGEDPLLWGYIQRYITKADAYMSNFTVSSGGEVSWPNGVVPEEFIHPYFLYDENGNRLDGVKTYAGETVGGSGNGDGYDEGGRMEECVAIADNLPTLAFAYQITGEIKYANAIYLVIKQLGTWAHWGDCHSLNVADTAVRVAKAIDWAWHAFDSNTAKRVEMCDILYNFGVVKGYYLYNNKSSTVLYHRDYYNNNQDGSRKICSHYGVSSSNNWQTVCGSGMIVSSLVLMGTNVNGSYKYDEYTKSVASSYIKSTKYAYEQYAPDGGYIESPGYWGYGTGTLFQTLGALKSAVGTDYGYLDGLGLQDSFYFVNYICDSTYRAWDYHDGSWSAFRGSAASAGNSWMYMAAQLYNDPNIAFFRDMMLRYSYCYYGIEDILFYEKGMADGHDEDLSYDYYSQSIETVTMRDSWEIGADFIGLHAGPNRGPHSDFDSGNFYLNLGGVLWCGDPGSENYNVGRFFNYNQDNLTTSNIEGGRYYYYKKSSESHNTIVINSLPYGQVYSDRSTNNYYAKITAKPTDNGTADGSFAIANMKPSYGETCSAAQRGLLYTNSRNTAVVQDEITFSSATSLTWVACVKNISSISSDGKSAEARINVGGEILRLRISLISDNQDLKFEMTGLTTILPGTVTKAVAAADREKYSYVDVSKASDPENRLIIKANNVTEFNVAVVFELIRHEDEVVGYEWKDMSTWATDGIVSDEWVKEANKDIDYGNSNGNPATPTHKYTITDLVMAMAKIDSAKTLSERMKAIYESFIRTTDIDTENAVVKAKIDELAPYLEEYNGYVRAINTVQIESVVDCVLPHGDD